MMRYAARGEQWGFVETNWVELNREIENNTAKKAAELFLSIRQSKPASRFFAKTSRTKRVWAAAAHGAAVIEGLDKLFETHLSYKDKCALAIRVGGTCRFLSGGQTAKVEGIGEKITPIYPALQREVLIIKPPLAFPQKRPTKT